MQKTKARSYSLSERIRIVLEYETSGLTLKEIANRYGILGHSTIAKWRYGLQKSGNYCNFAVEKRPQPLMNDPERQALEHQIADLERRLQKEKMKNLALNTLIDIAEEQGIQIRKKSEAKQ